MQGVDPCVWLTDVLPPIDSHPAGRVGGLTPGRCRALFAADPMVSDVGRATAGLPHAATAGAG